MNLCHDFRYGKIMYNQLDDFVGKSLKLYGEYCQGEAEIFNQLIKPGATVIEAGANIGAHTVRIAQLAGEDGKVYAFEPQRLVFQLLCGNIALNSLTNVYAYNKALGDAPGVVSIPDLDVHVANNWGGMEIMKYGFGNPVELITIDSLQLPACDFFKIDVEGMELNVLRGAEQTIKKYLPIIYTEVDRVENNPALYAYLHSLGYRIFHHNPPLFNPDNYFHNPENVLKNEKGVQYISINALCLHRSSGLKAEGFEEELVSGE